MSYRDAARCNWRADLHEFGAAAARGAGLVGIAEASEAEADRNRAYAALCGHLADAKASGDRLLVRNVSQAVAAFRQEWRADVTRVGVINDFSEPSDSELTGLGY